MSEKPKATTVLPGKVEKVINPQPNTGEPEKAQITVEGADHLYREIRVPNRLVDDDGRKVKLSDYHGKRVVLYFYPKDDTPG